ncbi:MAG: histidine--tRNA ligase [Patescibacteria group bacterium]
MRYTAPKGTRDILPGQIGASVALERLFLNLAAIYGYRELRTPIFERTELFARGLGDATDVVQKEMFSFLDRGGRSLTLRPELTAGAVRAYLEHNLAGEGPVTKLCYLGPAFRQERPQAGRYQQFTQYGVECFGSRDPGLDAEAIDLAIAFVHAAGLDEVKLLLNAIGCPGCRPAYREALVKSLEARRGDLCPTCLERLEKNPLRVLDCKSPACREATAGAPAPVDHLCDECAGHFQAVRGRLADIGRDYTLAPRLVRGLDYYTNTVFEVTAAGLGSQDSILGGGRYDGLVEACGGPPTPGVGFAGGCERLLIALQSAGRAPGGETRVVVFLAPFGHGDAGQLAFGLAHRLRAAGVATDLDYQGRSLKAQLREADRLGARAAVLLGPDELARNTAAVRWLDSKTQTEVPLASLVDYLRREVASLAEKK